MINKDKRVWSGYKYISDTNQVRLFSFGGGVQSTAVMVLQSLGKLPLPYDNFIFSNVGNDSESPLTIEYMRNYTIPFAKKHGIELIEVQKTTFKKPETLLDFMYRTPKSVPIPVRQSGGTPVGRSCTATWKIDVINKWIKTNGYSHAVTGLGISLDEYQRMRGEKWHDKYGKAKLGFWRKREHPLIDLRLTRQDCIKIIESVGLPRPPKSACWFCPFTKRNEWIEIKKSNVALFDEACKLEAHLSHKSGKPLYIHPPVSGAMVKLVNAVPNQMSIFDIIDDETCESGYCFN